MAGLNVSKWQAARHDPFYDPAMQFYLRMIRTAFDEARAVRHVPCPFLGGWDGSGEPIREGWTDAQVQAWDDAIMARDWIARKTPDRKTDEPGYLLSFEHCCEVLGLDADCEATWMLREIDKCADFDMEEIHARIAWLTENPPDEVEEGEFQGLRVVPALDQGRLFGGMAA